MLFWGGSLGVGDSVVVEGYLLRWISRVILLAIMIRFNSFKRLFSLSAAWLLFVVPAQALIIDTFLTPGLLSSSTTVGVVKTLHTPTSGAVGGGRSFLVTKTGAGAGISSLVVDGDGPLSFEQGTHASLATVTWDGDANPSSVKYNGLGGVDFTQDGASAFNLGLSYFDYPSSPMQVALRLYDASRSDGTKFSEVAITLDRHFNGPGTFTIELPFSLFVTAATGSIPAPSSATFTAVTKLGANGAIDIRNVGAITLTFTGTSSDITLTRFVTNGRCAAVPNAQGKVFDECSVCLDQADAGRGRDRCGTCLSGPSGYSYDANKVLDACGVCPSEAQYNFPSGTVDSCGVCVSGPPSYAYVDNTAVCASQKGNCSFVAPTKKIRGFEQQLLKKAQILKDRFVADVQRFLDRKCPGSIVAADNRVTAAYQVISDKGREVFRKGVQVCGDSCVTVSFASDVKALTPQFKILEREVTKTAQRVQACYRKLGVSPRPTKGGGRAAQTIAGVRQDLSKLIKDCQKTKVCPKK